MLWISKLLMKFCEANMKDRVDVREQIEHNLDNLNVIVTTYGLAKRKEDNKFLRHLKPVVCLSMLRDSTIVSLRSPDGHRYAYTMKVIF